MSDIVSLDQYRERATVKHGDLPVQVDENTTVILRRPMRMSSDERRTLFAAEQRIGNAQAEHPAVVKARRVLKAAKDRHAILDPESSAKVQREHEKRVAEAETALEVALEENPTDGAAQVDELIEGMRDMFRAIADNRDKVERLLSAAGDDTYVLQEIMAEWRGKAEPGEAQPSPA